MSAIADGRKAEETRSPANAGAQYSPGLHLQKTLGSCLRRRTAVLLAPLLLTACASVELPAGPAPIDPIAFFTGETHGTGSLNPIVGKATNVTVASTGTPTASGLRLVQRITEGAKPERTRIWVIAPAGPGRFTGTLTDAAGPVTMTVAGPRAFVAYATPSGLRIRQQLALQSDGRTILNHLEAFKLGVRVASLDETIRKPLAK